MYGLRWSSYTDLEPRQGAGQAPNEEITGDHLGLPGTYTTLHYTTLRYATLRYTTHKYCTKHCVWCVGTEHSFNSRVVSFECVAARRVEHRLQDLVFTAKSTALRRVYRLEKCRTTCPAQMGVPRLTGNIGNVGNTQSHGLFADSG